MIIGYNFFGYTMHGTVFDTAIPTSELDEAVVNEGIYDEIFLSVDTTINATNEKPNKWRLKHIMDAKFRDDVEGGSLDNDGYKVTKIQIYRRKFAAETKWILIGQFDYDIDFNVYSFIDKTAENNVYYEYAVVPISKKIVGEVTISEPIQANFEGTFISDLDHNYKMEIDYTLGDIIHNSNQSYITPLNAKYPIAVCGNQNYRTGNISFTPITEEQIRTGGTVINGRDERQVRQPVVDFLQNGKAKIYRSDNGEVMIITTTGVKETPKAVAITDIRNVSFDYTEMGAVEYDTLSKNGLIGRAVKSKYTYDENGEVVWDM